MNIKDFDSFIPFTIGNVYKDIFCSLEVAKLAKQIGFNIPTRHSVTEYTSTQVNEQDGASGPFGWEEGELEFDGSFFINGSSSDYSNESYTSYALPTLATLQGWLREAKGISVWITPNEFSSAPNIWVYNLTYYQNGKLLEEIVKATDDKHMGPDQALNNGIHCALHILSNLEQTEE